VASSSSPEQDFHSIEPPTAGLIDVAVNCSVGDVVSVVEADEHPAIETNKTEAISVLRST
jgi:hypothetical protein